MSRRAVSIGFRLAASRPLSAAPSFAAKWLVPRLGRFEAAHRAGDGGREGERDRVDGGAGESDRAIRYGAGPYPGLEAIRRMRETVIPVMSPDLMAANPIA